jgi:hypothetical protein
VSRVQHATYSATSSPGQSLGDALLASQARNAIRGVALTTAGPRRVTLTQTQPPVLTSGGKEVDVGTVFEVRLWQVDPSVPLLAAETRWVNGIGSAVVDVIAGEAIGGRVCLAVSRSYLSGGQVVQAVEVFSVTEPFGNLSPTDQLFRSGLE